MKAYWMGLTMCLMSSVALADSVTSHGARGDGSTDDTGAFAAAIAAGGTVTVNAGSLIGGGNMVIGDQGLGTLTIENGGTVTATAGLLGVQTGSSGSSVTVTGAGSSWTLSGGLEIGINADAALTIANGGAVNLGSSQQIYLGNGNGNGSGSGTLTVNGGTLSDSGGQIFVGSNGSGTAADQEWRCRHHDRLRGHRTLWWRGHNVSRERHSDRAGFELEYW